METVHLNAPFPFLMRGWSLKMGSLSIGHWAIVLIIVIHEN
jgi:hypothetical protein